MKCFNCDSIIQSAEIPCPKCGYMYSETQRYCPNSNFGLCQITEIPCREGISWQRCSIKNKADNESW